ncbi:MAG: phosphoribosylglycinamide formyltransferase [Tessaracoccus sp.]
MSLRVVVLLSGTGTLCQALFDAIDEGVVDAEVVAVVSDQQDAHGLERAKQRGIPAVAHPLTKGAVRGAWDEELRDIVAAFGPDLVASAGFMKLLGPAFLGEFGGRTINTHPALLPSFPGMHGPRDALRAGVKVSGATVFLVDAGVDTGKILLQEAVNVRDDDTVESLHERIKVAERRLLVKAVAEWPPAPAPADN